jgi:phosphoribosylaminoimidazole-succinocarboxamide synthase
MIDESAPEKASFLCFLSQFFFRSLAMTAAETTRIRAIDIKTMWAGISSSKAIPFVVI